MAIVWATSVNAEAIKCLHALQQHPPLVDKEIVETCARWWRGSGEHRTGVHACPAVCRLLRNQT
jgi:hypothetical protein